MGLDRRKLLILKAIIDDYIVTAIPIGSRTVSKKIDLDLSSATIRNEMFDLEEMGYLDQPHTSAGRIPSQKAYRYYVDEILKKTALTAQEAHQLNSYFNEQLNEVEKVIASTAKALSDVTNYTSLVLKPQLNKISLEHIQLVYLGQGRALLVIVTDAGLVKDTIIEVPVNMDANMLFSISQMLTEKLRGSSISELKTRFNNIIDGEMQKHRQFFNALFDTIEEELATKGDKDVIYSGAKNILNYPEYNDIEKAKNFFKVLEKKDTIYKMLENAADFEFTVKIGSENEDSDFKDCSIVTATYKIGEKTIGSFGVIGPVRMNYTKVISVIDYMGKSLSEIMTQMNKTNNNFEIYDKGRVKDER